MEAHVNEPGRLVTIKPGNYLTDITRHPQTAMLMLESPTLGIVLEEETNGLNLVQVQNDMHGRIYARNSALLDAETENRNG